MRKVLTVVGTRPELIKMSRVIASLDTHTHHFLAHTGQNYDYELNQVFFDDFNLRKPDYFLSINNTSAANAISDVISKTDDLLEEINPEALMLYGDTNSCLACISAKRRKIPIFHMEAGNRCFDQRVPEEINRKVVDHLSDINMVLTEHARHNLLREGLPSSQIIKTGSHMPEVLNFYKSKIEKSDILARIGIQEKRYFLVSSHREENVDNPSRLASLIDSLNLLASEYDIPIIFSTHPRTKSRLDKISTTKPSQLIKFSPPFGFFDYITLQKNSLATLSDSGTITEESALLGFPAITIRNTHERPEGMDAGVLIMSSNNPASVLDSVKASIDLSQSKYSVNDYSYSQVSAQVTKIVLSYIDYIQANTWKVNL